jgi:hypothetical protein
VYSIRATRKLLTAMRAAPLRPPPAPTTVLGDWYVNVTNDNLVLSVSEKTLLPVVLPCEALSALASELPRALALVLDALGIERAAIERERFEMARSAVSTTANRRVVGFLNEFAIMMQATSDHRRPRSLLETSVYLAHTPCNASAAKCVTWPDAATRAAFGFRTLE